MHTRKLHKRKSAHKKRMTRHKRTRRHARRSNKHSSNKQMRGGYAVPLFGAPYNAAALNPKGTYYPYNPNVEQWPSQSNAMLGGGKKGMRSGQKGMRSGQKGMRSGKKGKRIGQKGTRMRMKGGGITEFVTSLLPQEVVNIGRSLPAGIGHMYDKFNGIGSMPSSQVFPTQQPSAANINSGDMIRPSDISKYYLNSNRQVSGI